MFSPPCRSTDEDGASNFTIRNLLQHLSLLQIPQGLLHIETSTAQIPPQPVYPLLTSHGEFAQVAKRLCTTKTQLILRTQRMNQNTSTSGCNALSIVIGSEHFPNFAIFVSADRSFCPPNLRLFTTLLRRVRLSQSAGCYNQIYSNMFIQMLCRWYDEKSLEPESV